MYPLSPKLPSRPGCPITLSRVLCTVGPHWLPILNTAMCTCPSQAPCPFPPFFWRAVFQKAWAAVNKTSKTSSQLFHVWIGVLTGKRSCGDRRSLGKENSGAVWAKRPEFSLQRAVIELLMWAAWGRVLLSLTARWLRPDDCRTPPMPAWQLVLPWVRKLPSYPCPGGWIICSSASWLCLLLALNPAAIQLCLNYPFRNDSLNVLPGGPVPTLITKNCCCIKTTPLFVLFSASFC